MYYKACSNAECRDSRTKGSQFCEWHVAGNDDDNLARPERVEDYVCVCLLCSRRSYVRWPDRVARLHVQAGLLRCATCGSRITVEADRGAIGGSSSERPKGVAWRIVPTRVA